MGMFDYVRIEAEMPGVPSLPGHFQTKSLDRALEYYTITKVGRLVRNSGEHDPPPDGETWKIPASAQDVDMDFHGDMNLIGDEAPYPQYVARFTHGMLEWIRPLDEIPEGQRPRYC